MVINFAILIACAFSKMISFAISQGQYDKISCSPTEGYILINLLAP